MTYETILYNVQDHVATITLNRPEQYNALTTQMYRDLHKAFRDIQRDTEVRSVILTGAGKSFCSGQDLIELSGLIGKISISDALWEGLNPLILNIRALEKPVICAVNGVTAGAGTSLALACDLRIASDKASFVFAAFTNIGIIPDGGATYLLPQLVGVSRAFELATLADRYNRVDAERALEWGLVNEVAPHDDLPQQVANLSVKMAKMATRAVGMTKKAIYRATERSIRQALEYEAQLQEATFKTHDFQEGVQAFVEKREPNFRGE